MSSPMDVPYTEASVDWLTITTGDTERRKAVFAMFEEACNAMRSLGEEPQVWTFLGYKGLLVTGVRWGTRKEDDIAIVSGMDAARWWQRLADFRDNCSRVDLAVTCFPPTAMYDVAARAFERLGGWNVPAAINRRYTFLRNNQGGQTLYIGSRSSDQFGRLYDKACQLKPMQPAGTIWRYEVEFKHDRAELVLKGLIASESGHRFPDSIVPTVWDWYEERGIAPIFGRNTTVPALPTQLQATVSTDQMQLDWLRRQVSPAVRRLVSKGYGAQLRELFTLSDED